MRVCRGNIKLRQRQKYMPEDISWGPVIGQNTVTGHGVLPLPRPQKPLKQLLPFVRSDTFYWATACRFYRTDTLRVLYVAAPQVFYWAYISEIRLVFIVSAQNVYQNLPASFYSPYIFYIFPRVAYN